MVVAARFFAVMTMTVVLPERHASAEVETLAQAIRLYKVSRFVTAEPLLDRIASDTSREISERALAGLYLGFARKQANDDEGATAALRAAFQLLPEVVLPPDTPPELVRLAEECRTSVQGELADSEPAPVPPPPPQATLSPARPQPPPTPPATPGPAPAPEQATPPGNALVPRADPPAADGFLFGVDSRFLYIPADQYGSPTLDLLVGTVQHTPVAAISRTAAVLGVLFGVHDSYLAGFRADIASPSRPFSFGGGLDVNLIVQPSEPFGLPPFLIQAMANVLNVAGQWGAVLLEWRVLSVGATVRLATAPPLARLMLDSGLTIAWAPERRQ